MLMFYKRDGITWQAGIVKSTLLCFSTKLWLQYTTPGSDLVEKRNCSGLKSRLHFIGFNRVALALAFLKQKELGLSLSGGG
jgi:hypothetical protein